MENAIYPREKYLSKIRPFYDSDVVKVITGIKRSGKTSILKAIISELPSLPETLLRRAPIASLFRF